MKMKSFMPLRLSHFSLALLLSIRYWYMTLKRPEKPKYNGNTWSRSPVPSGHGSSTRPLRRSLSQIKKSPALIPSAPPLIRQSSALCLSNKTSLRSSLPPRSVPSSSSSDQIPRPGTIAHLRIGPSGTLLLMAASLASP